MDQRLKLITIGVSSTQINLLRQKQQSLRFRVTSMIAFHYWRRLRKRYRKKVAWVFPMHNQFWELSVPMMDNDRFKSKYRIDRGTFDYLTDVLQPHMQRQTTKMRAPIPVDKRLAIALHCLKSGADYDTISTTYGIGKSSVGPILKDACKMICKVLGPLKIKLPSLDTDLEDVVSGFGCRWNFPGSVGACDGTHFPILLPTYCPEDYYNYKGWKSMHTLALVDYKYMFRYVSAGAAGKNSDSSVYNNCLLSSETSQSQLFPPETDYHIIGGSAFALRENMMKPYPEHRGLSSQQFNFNYRLSRARMIVECAFGRLKARWRILMKRCDLKTEDMPMIIMTCCILHNICEERKDEVMPSWLSEYSQHLQQFPQPNYINGRDYCSSASEKRDRLASLLFDDSATRLELSDADATIFNAINR